MSWTPKPSPPTADDHTNRLFSLLRYCDHAELQAATFNEFEELPLNFDQRDEAGDTLLHVAIKSGAPYIAKMLIGRGAPLDATNKVGQTPLHVAAIYYNEKIVLALLEAGSLTDVIDHSGYSPLHHFANKPFSIVSDAVVDALCAAADFNPHPERLTSPPANDALSANTLHWQFARISPLVTAINHASWNLAWELIHRGAYVPPGADDTNIVVTNHLKAAHQCFEDFIANPDPTQLLHEDLMLLANIGKLADLFIPSVWEKYYDQLPDIFASLPAYLQHEIFSQQLWLSEVLPEQTPTPQVRSVFLQTPPPEKPHQR